MCPRTTQFSRVAWSNRTGQRIVSSTSSLGRNLESARNKSPVLLMSLVLPEPSFGSPQYKIR
jgi:hypothetical protein